MSGEHTPAAFRSAIDDGDLGAAAAVAEGLQSVSITERLDRLATAIAERRYDDAEVQFQALVDQYARDRAETRRRVAAARSAQTLDSLSVDDRQALAEYTRTVTATRATRAQVLSRVGELLVERTGSRQQPGAVADTVETAKSREQTRQSRRSSATSVVDSASIPATLAIRSVTLTPERLSPGETTSVRVELTNVGDGTATDVTATVSLSATGSSQLTYGDVGPGTRAERSLDLTPTESGTRTVSVEAVAGETATVSRSETLVVDGGAAPPSDLRARFDDGDGTIQAREVLRMISAYNSGTDVTAREVLAVIDAFNRDAGWSSVEV